MDKPMTERAGEGAMDADVDERVCDRCARRAYRWTTVDDATICGDCMDEHERALDAATNAVREKFALFRHPRYGTELTANEYREIIAVGVKAYIEWPADA